MTPGLALAIERVKADAPPPLTLEKHSLSLRWLGEELDRRDAQQGKAASSAA